jgi:flagellar basal body rod protein FlgF
VTSFESSTSVQSAIAYFEKTVPTLTSVSQFENNSQLMDFVLSAFGLDSEAQYPGLIKQVLSQDPNNANSLVNQLTDPRFKQLATALDFYDYGLGKLQGVAQPQPTTATQTLPGATVTPQTGVSLGISVQGGGYLRVTKADGTTAYAKSIYMTVNSENQLVASDGSTLYPSYSIPKGTTALTVEPNGDIYAQAPETTTNAQTGVTTTGPTTKLVGQLFLANFSNPSGLKENSSGYYTATPESGAVTTGAADQGGFGTTNPYQNTYQDLINSYVTNEFEVAVGNQNDGVREALYFAQNAPAETDATGVNAEQTNADALLGDAVLRDVVTTAIDQPTSIAEQDLSTQEQIFESGVNIPDLQDPSYVNTFVQRYLTTYDANNASSTTTTSPALQILSSYATGDALSATNSAVSSILSLIA